MSSKEEVKKLSHLNVKLPFHICTRSDIQYVKEGLTHHVNYLKWAGSFFKTKTNVLDGISGITKNIIFFHLKACERRNFDFCVFLRVYSMPVKTGLYKLNGEWDVVTPGPTRPPGILHIRKNTQQSKFFRPQALKWKKNYVFRNPRDAI